MQEIKCLIDTGSSTSIIKPNILNEEYPKQILQKSCYYRTLNGVNEIKFFVTTPFPKEFPSTGTLQWKVVDFTNEHFSAIIGQNFLIPLKANINNEQKFVDISGYKIYFEEYNYPSYVENICLFEPLNIENTSRNIKLDHLNSEERSLTTKLILDFKDLFYREGDVLSATCQVEHEIITTIDKPLHTKIYRYPQIYELEIQKQIKDMLRQNIIRESNSPFNSPLWVVEKKLDNSGLKKYRIVIDYRKLNEYTVSDKYPIPNLNCLLDKLGKSQYFTTIDMAKGFYQIPVREEDRKKTAFSTPQGHYEFVRMPFGLKNAPSTFQRLMNNVLRDFINKICIVYMDDILVFSTSLQEHLESLKCIFTALRKAKLKIQTDKCNFLKKETQFLGHLLTTSGVKPNMEKVAIIRKLKIPTTAKQIKSFLGITGFYRKFVKDYAKIAYPMTRFLKKGQTVNTNDPCYIVAFEKLKHIITNAPILRYPNFNKVFKIITDASNFAIGSVLTQDGHPIAYASRTLNKHETNYSTIEKELLAIVWSVKYFRPYVYGKRFELESDHQPLKWLITKYSLKDINPRLQRWLVILGEYDFQLDYIKGKNNNVADFLSRINNDEINAIYSDNFTESFERMFDCNIITDGNDNDEIDSMNVQTIHSEEEFLGDHIPILDTVVNRFKIQIVIVASKETCITNIFNNKRIYIDKNDIDNGTVIDIIRREIVKGKVGIYSALNDHEYNKVQNLLLNEILTNPHLKFVKCSRFARDIENDEELDKQIALYHKIESGHCGIIATYEGIKQKIFNPNLREHIHKIINNCEICTGGKYDRNPIKNKFSLTETPITTNEIVHIDTYVNSKQSFIIFLDKFSKHATCFPLTDRNNTTLVENIRQFLAIKGHVKKFVFDNEFNTILIRAFLDSEGIHYHATKPNSHTGNSDAERLNNTITEKIRTFNIEEKLPIVTQMNRAIMCYNNTFHSSLKCTPFEVQNNKIDHTIIYEQLKKIKQKNIKKANEKREVYEENRETGFIKNYKSLRHKEEPKFRKQNLRNIHVSNIKRKFKY